MYNNTPLSGLISDLGAGFGVVVTNFPTNGIQNGSPDGIALVDNGTTVQFVSYEGAFAAVGGPANGLTSTDIEAFVEVFGEASADNSAFTILEIEGYGPGGGTIDAVLQVGTTDSGGYWTNDEDMENGTITILLVENFTGAVGLDLDTNNDGTFDSMPWTLVVDDVATTDGGASDLRYSSTVLGPFFDGNPFGAGDASRIPNGIDTDTAVDWVRNDFDGAGFSGFCGTPSLTEALNTPGAANALPVSVPEPATLTVLGLGLAGFGYRRRKQIEAA